MNVLKGEYLHLTVEDLGFSTGEIKFKLKLKPLLNEPKLNL